MDVPHPITGLTPRDVRTIRKNWIIVSKDLEGMGTSLFLNFFRENPMYIRYFPEYHVRRIEELLFYESFKSHGYNVMKAIGETIEHLDEHYVLLEQFQAMGRIHGIYKIRPQAFTDLAFILQGLIRHKCRMPAEGMVAWEKYFDFAVRIMTSREHQQSQQIQKF